MKLATIEQVRRLLGSDALDNASPARVEELRAEAGIRLDRQKQLREEQLSNVLAELQTMPERERAVFELRAQEWIAEVTEAPDADPGVVWEDLGVDLIVVDEAQNYKNLWPAEEREGGIPKYLGAISEGSQRAWDLALRAFEIRERNGGGGVILLSATPAKTAPRILWPYRHGRAGRMDADRHQRPRGLHRSLPRVGDPQRGAVGSAREDTKRRRRVPAPQRATGCPVPLRRVQNGRGSRAEATRDGQGASQGHDGEAAAGHLPGPR